MEKENIDVFLDEEGNNANDIRLGHQKGDLQLMWMHKD